MTYIILQNRNYLYHILISQILLWCSIFSAFSQSVNDTISIQEVCIFQKRIDDLAGFKQTEIDSLVLLDNLNANVSNILAVNTPVVIKTYGQGALSTASFRGASASHTQVSWNGININSPMPGQVDFSLIPTFFVDAITVNYGAAGLEKQSGALGGSIDISNRPDWDNRFSLQTIAGSGSFGTYRTFLGLRVGNKKIQSTSRFFWKQSKNNFEFTNDVLAKKPFTERRKNADYSQKGFVQEFYARLNEKNMLSCKLWSQWNFRNIPQPTVVTGTNKTEQQHDNSHKVVLQWKRYAENSELSYLSGFIYENLDYDLNFSGGIGSIMSRNTTHSLFNRFQFNYLISKRWRIKTAITDQYHRVESNNYENRKERHQLSFLGIVERNIGKLFTVYSLMRQEFSDFEPVPLIPSLGLNVKPLPDIDVVLGANISRNYHQPSLNDLYWDPGGNPDLKDEKGIIGEINFSYQSKKDNSLVFFVKTTAFYSHISDWIVWQPSDFYYWTPKNIKKVCSRGVETKMTITWKYGHFTSQLKTGYSFTNVQNKTKNMPGNQLIYIPKHQYNCAAHLSYRGWSFSWYQYATGKKYTDVENSYAISAYSISDINLAYKINQRNFSLSFQLKIDNLWNRYYEVIKYYPMPGRFFHFSIHFDYSL